MLDSEDDDGLDTPTLPLTPICEPITPSGTPRLKSAMKRKPSIQRHAVHGLEVVEVKEFEVTVLLHRVLNVQGAYHEGEREKKGRENGSIALPPLLMRHSKYIHNYIPSQHPSPTLTLLQSPTPAKEVSKALVMQWDERVSIMSKPNATHAKRGLSFGMEPVEVGEAAIPSGIGRGGSGRVSPEPDLGAGRVYNSTDDLDSDEDAVFNTPDRSRSRVISSGSDNDSVDGDDAVYSKVPMTPLMQSSRAATSAAMSSPGAPLPADPISGRGNNLTVKQMVPALNIGPFYRQFIRYTRARGQPVGLALLEPVRQNQAGVPNGVFVSSVLPCGAATATFGSGAAVFRPGDRIIEVNATNTEVMTLAEVSDLLGSSVGEMVVSVSRVVPAGTSNNSAAVTSVSGRPHKHVSIATARGCGSVTHPVPLPMMDPIGCARNVIVHRHPNSGSLHIAIETHSFHMGTLPQITFDSHPSSPDAPLIEGGVLQNGDELLEVDGVVVVGLWPADMVAVLKGSGDAVVLRVVAKAKTEKQRRTISSVLMYEGKDPETVAFSNAVRRNLYSWLSPVSTRATGTRDDRQVMTPIRFKAVAAQNAFMEWMQHPNGEYYGLPHPEFAGRYGVEFPDSEETTEFFDGFANANGQLNSGAATLSNSIEDLLTSVEPLSQLCTGFQRTLPVNEGDDAVLPLPDANGISSSRLSDSGEEVRWQRAARMTRGYSGTLLTPGGARAVVERRRSRIDNIMMLQCSSASSDSFFAPNTDQEELPSDPTPDPLPLPSPMGRMSRLRDGTTRDSIQIEKSRNIRKSPANVGPRSQSMTSII